MSMSMRLKEIRLAKGLTQEDLASKLGITQSNLSRMESGEVQMSLNMAIAITKECGCTLDELIGEPEEDHENDNAG